MPLQAFNYSFDSLTHLEVKKYKTQLEVTVIIIKSVWQRQSYFIIFSTIIPFLTKLFSNL